MRRDSGRSQRQITEAYHENLIDQESYEVMLTNMELWDPQISGHTNLNYDHVGNLSTTSSILRNFETQDEESSGLSQKTWQNRESDQVWTTTQTNVIGFGDNQPVEATPNNLEDGGNYEETIKLTTPETESCEQEEPSEETRPLSLTM